MTPSFLALTRKPVKDIFRVHDALFWYSQRACTFFRQELPVPTKYYLHPVGPQQVQIVFALGDIHGLWNQLNAVINTNIRQNSRLRRFGESTKVEVVVLQCGDFGYWPHTGQAADAVSNIKNAVPFLHDGHVKIFWCDGNHENHDELDALERRHPGQPFLEVAPHIHFATFDSVLKLAAGNVLFAGGAVSSDKAGRTPGESWWAQETIDDADMARLPEVADMGPPRGWTSSCRTRHRACSPRRAGRIPPKYTILRACIWISFSVATALNAGFTGTTTNTPPEIVKGVNGRGWGQWALAVNAGA